MQGATAELRALVDLATADPVEARHKADRLLSSVKDSDLFVKAHGLWARGLAAREQLDLERALIDLSESSRLLVEAGDEETAAKVRSSLAVVHIRRGDFDIALRLVDEADQWLDGIAAARNGMQRGLALQRMGEPQPALAAYEAALPGLRDGGDLVPAAGMLSNMGVLLAYEGRFERAVECLSEALELAERTGQDLLRAMTLHNLAFALGRRGSIVTALAHFDRAIALHRSLGLTTERLAFVNLDRAEVLASAGLIGEARASVTEGLSRLTHVGSEVDVAEAHLLAARLALVAADHAAARASARSAAEIFERQGRESWHLLAKLIELAATDDPSSISPTDVEQLANQLQLRGWDAESRQARLFAARAALMKGDPRAAEQMLVQAAVTEDKASAMELAEAAHARAMLAVAKGETDVARQAVQSGLSMLDEYRATLGSVELRAHSAVLGRDLIQLGLRLALQTRDPWEVIETVEMWRAASLRTPPPKLPDDPELHHAMARLRSIDSRIHRDDGGTAEDVRSERIVLENQIRHRMRRTAAQGPPETSELSRDTVDEARGGRTLASFIRNGDRLCAVTISGSGIRQLDVMPIDEVSRLASGITFGLQRLARSVGSQAGSTVDASGSAAEEAIREDARELFDRLFAHIDVEPGLVIVPTGVLYRLPWTAIVENRPVVVTPSIGSWLRANSNRKPVDQRAPAALIAGPGLPGAKSEVERLARRYPNRIRLTGRNATADRVIDALEWCTVAHLAAHGAFRSDNPLFSALQLADGPLTVYEIERLESPPSIVVMPSCDTAVTDVLVGDEVLGFASALMHLGVSTVVAPVVPIPDEATGPLMIELHKRLISGQRADEALAAIAANPNLGPAERMAISAFVVIGS